MVRPLSRQISFQRSCGHDSSFLSIDTVPEIAAAFTMKPQPKHVVFVEMMGVPGSYDASVYDHFEDKDKEVDLTPG